MDHAKNLPDKFVEIVFEKRRPTPKRPTRKRNRFQPLFIVAILLILIIVLLVTTLTPNGKSTPEALAKSYAQAMMKDRPGAVFRLFPSALTSRRNGSREGFVEEMDEFCYAYGQGSDYTLLANEDYPDELHQTFATILNTEIGDYRHLIVGMTIDGRDRQLHLDVLQIKNKWYLAEVWNDDVLPGVGFDQPEEAAEAYFTAFMGNSADGLSLALAPSLTESAIAKGYGLRQMLGEVDDFYAAGQLGSPVSYTPIRTTNYSAYQTQSIAEILESQPQAYRAYYYDAVVGENVYTLVIDLVQVDGRWGITRIWDYHKEYMI